MTKTFWTAGYTSHKTADLKVIAAKLDAIVFDIRFSPYSRNPAWAGGNLRQVLADRYQHIGELGNRNYKSAPIDIVDSETGIARIAQSVQPVILLCACPEYRHCHRSTITRMLNNRGYSYQGEVEWPKPEPKPKTPALVKTETLTLF